MRGNWFLSTVFVIAVPATSYAGFTVWSDDFADGDDTSNPTWVHYNSGTGINPSWSVVDDGTGNLVYELSVESNGVDTPVIGSYVPIFLLSDGKETNKPIDGFRSNAKGLLTSFSPSNVTGYGLMTDITGPDDANKEFTVTLGRLDFGVTTVLASTTMPFTTDWMTDLIEVEDGRVRAKKWLTSDAEPSGYLFDVFDDTYTDGGFTGIVVGTDPANPKVTWQFDDIEGSTIPEPSTLAIWGVLGRLGLIATRRRRRQAA